MLPLPRVGGALSGALVGSIAGTGARVKRRVRRCDDGSFKEYGLAQTASPRLQPCSRPSVSVEERILSRTHCKYRKGQRHERNSDC
jgi:hypothetical protein